MGYPGFIAFAGVFHLLVISVQSDLIGGGLSPIFSPVFGDVCRNVQCGRGRCKTSANSTFPYECECDSGWLQSPLSDSLQFDLKFLPCTFPNCTMDTACGVAPPPIQEKTNRANASFFDPCFWVDCGGGTCNQTSIFTHNCTCFEGYYNLFNVSSFPCYHQCDVELSCSDRGLGLNNHSAPPPSSLNQNSGGNQEDVCRNVQCGRGRCKTSASSTFPYECECDSGWLQSPLSDSLQFNLKFLPCTFPNCTMNTACGVAPPPIQEKTNRGNASFFDPCFWVDCGGGTCNQTSIFTHKCTCFEGYYNLFNVSSFPCYQQCNIELSCSDLGIGLNNHSAPPPSSLNQNSGDNQAAADLIQGNSQWTLGLILLLFSILLM